MKKIISLILCGLMMMSLVPISVMGANIEYKDKDGKTIKVSDFRDTQGHWAHNQIFKWADYGVVAGNNGNFMPNNKIIRGDLAIIIDRMMGLKNITYNYFSDLSTSDYYRESILKCVAEGYINGVTLNKVNPKGFATREEVAVILCRVFNIDTSYSGSTHFSDDYSISSWARPSIYALSKLGYMNGTGSNMVKPKANITRAEMITILNNIADTYIPKKDIDNSGSVYIGNYSKNVVTSRNIELKNSTIGRNLYLTQSVSSLILSNTTVYGSLIVYSKGNLSLNNSKVEQIILRDGKSSIQGVTENINEVYVCEYASESSLDAIPNKLVLEPGVRVRVNNIMYENTSSRSKTYYGNDLKAAISDEQGYVVGGPKVSGVKYSLDFSNVLTMSNIRVVAGENTIREIGVIWLDNDEDEDPINPTYSNNDGKERYTGAYNEPFSFKISDAKEYRTYRIYVRDSEGLYAYSTPYTTKGYTFSTDIKVTDVDYPEKIQVEVSFKGVNVPDIKSVRVIYDVHELYSEKHNIISLKKYTESYAENPIDETKYKRFIGTITVPNYKEDNEIVYEVPTAFGYIIEFDDGRVINRFPVVTNIIPTGIKPVTSLTTGNINFSSDNSILLKNNKLITNHVAVQEVGVVYLESNSDSIASPVDNASDWTRVVCDNNIPVKDTCYFDALLTIHNSYLNTFYAPYVKTSNGYYYGSTSKIQNNWQGDTDGPRISADITSYTVSKTDAIVSFDILSGKDLDLYNKDCFVSVLKNGSSVSDFSYKSLNDLEYYFNPTNYRNYIHLNNLEPNSDYSFLFRVKGNNGQYSNIISFNISTKNLMPITLNNKNITSNGIVTYDINYNINNYEKIILNDKGHSFVNLTNPPNISVSDDKLVLTNNTGIGKEINLRLNFVLPDGSINKIYTFNRGFILN